jgi:hypothetical protein
LLCGWRISRWRMRYTSTANRELSGMMKVALAGLVMLGSASVAAAMPMASQSAGVSLPVVKAAVVVKKVVRRPVVRRHVVKKKIIIR